MTITRFHRRTLLGAGALSLTAFLAACSSDEPMTSEEPMDEEPMEDEPMDAEPMEEEPMDAAGMSEGAFAGANDKSVSGMVTIDADTLSLTEFSSDEGPDLHLYLTSGDDEAAVTAGTELGKVAWDEAEQSFPLDGMDLSQVDHVVVHCDKAKAVFGSAPLS